MQQKCSEKKTKSFQAEQSLPKYNHIDYSSRKRACICMSRHVHITHFLCAHIPVYTIVLSAFNIQTVIANIHERAV